MKIYLENIERIISELIYKNLSIIDKGTLELNCELNDSGLVKLDGCFIYRAESNDNIIPLFADFNCRITKEFPSGSYISKPVQGSFNASYDNKSKELVEGSFNCLLKD